MNEVERIGDFVHRQQEDQAVQALLGLFISLIGPIFRRVLRGR